MADSYLAVAPQELTFKFELKKSIPVALQLTNVTTERLAFKIKTTSPKKYCVRPSSGIIEPNSVKEVQVIMQPQREMPASFADCKDKFLVQCVMVGAEVKDVSPDLFDASKAGFIKQTKLRVVLVAPARPPSPVPEGNESDQTSPPPLPSIPIGFMDDAGRQKRLASLESLPAAETPMATARKSPAGPVSGYGFISLLLVALLAFVIGHYAQTSMPELTDKFEALKEELMKKFKTA